jgi:hypothetical protein
MASSRSDTGNTCGGERAMKKIAIVSVVTGAVAMAISALVRALELAIRTT